MAVPEDQPTSTADRLVAAVRGDRESQFSPRYVTATLGLVTAVLVAASTLSAIRTGHTAIGYSFLVAVALFLGSVGAFEAAQRFGGD